MKHFKIYFSENCNQFFVHALQCMRVLTILNNNTIRVIKLFDTEVSDARRVPQSLYLFRTFSILINLVFSFRRHNLFYITVTL